MGSVDSEVPGGGAGGEWTCCGEWQSGGAAAAFDGDAAEDREGVVIPVLEKVGVPVEQLLSGVNAAIAKLPKVQGGGQPGMSAALQKVLEQGFKERKTLRTTTFRLNICCWRCRRRRMIRCNWHWPPLGGRMRRS